MFRRIYYDFIKGNRTVIIKTMVYTVLFSFLFSAYFIRSLSTAYEAYFEKQFDLFVSISAPVNEYNYGENIEEYFTEVAAYRALMDRLREDENVIYHDLEASALARNPLISLEIGEDGTLRLFYTMSSDSYTNAIEYQHMLWSNEPFFWVANNLKSTRNSNPLDFKFQAAHLKEGRSFTQQEIDEGAAVCIANANMAFNSTIAEETAWPVALGDIVTITEVIRINGEVYNQKVCELEVIGTYETKDGNGIQSSDKVINHPLYIPEALYTKLMNHTFSNIMETYPDYLNEAFYNKTFQLHPGVFQLENIEGLEKFILHVEKELDSMPDGYKYYASTDTYAMLLANVLSVTSSFELISYILLVLCFVISLVMIAAEVFYRRKEIGILLSLGLTRMQIVMQYTIEFILMAIVSTVIALLCSRIIAISFTSYLTSEEIINDNTTIQKVLSDSYLYQKEDVEFVITDDTRDVTELLVYECYLVVFHVILLFLLVARLSPKELMNEE